ncbi:MAG: ammonia-forming cytochrome c nitrite reductase subunit c552 [Coriobacteriia bacterium]|nr:ammonia-forming cytochrome c nitrite reductase subunit c552 [Coriobacteriia bacterium]
MKNLKPLVWLSVIILIVVMVCLAACNPKKPEPNELGVITAEQWKDIHPDVYESFMKNTSNTAKPSYLTQYPFLVTIYDGMGFAKDYNEARGHPYTLEDVAATGRPHLLANCLTCKSPEMTALVNSEGVGVYSTDFAEIYAKISESVSCYNCHENTDGELVVTAGYLKDALGADMSKVDSGMLVCGQCHNEYYFDPTTKATILPWNGLSNMNPDAILAYYNAINFSDFTNSISGAAMIKVQHPEFETINGTGSMASGMGNRSCGDCHMGTTTNSKGVEFISHNWMSPVKNQEIQDERCNSCHKGNLPTSVAAIQKTTHDRLVTIGGKLADLHIKIGQAAQSGASEALLAELRLAVRNGQFYFDFVFVENSYGAHNSALTKQLLDKAEQIIDQALAKL